MNESLLQFIWHNRYFNAWDLHTANGEALELIDTGNWNKNQGPDFLHARVRIAGQYWAGNIELHVKTSEWELHGHSGDRNYDNVVLHVVWEHDKTEDYGIPVLELCSRVPRHLLQQYRKWMMRNELIPCSGEIATINAAIVSPWLEWLWLKRVKARAFKVLDLVLDRGGDWEEAFWISTARAFGHKVNADAFEAVASTLPVKLMMRHRHNLIQLEALLFGQAGLLRADKGDEYAQRLFREYGFLRKKYQLLKCYQPVHFLRMRPGNFPTLRLAQLAGLMYSRPNIFGEIVSMRTAEEMVQFFRVQAGEYWDHHYRFGELSTYAVKHTGDHFIENLILNTVIPFLAAYHTHKGQCGQVDSLMEIMRKLKPEQDSVITYFERLGIRARHAADTQGLHELRKNYCDRLNCLECAIGRALLKTSINSTGIIQ